MLSDSSTYVALLKAAIIGVRAGGPSWIAASDKDFSLDRDIQTESKTHTASVLPRTHREMFLLC